MEIDPEQRHITSYDAVELATDSDLFRAAADYVRLQRELAPPRVPGESEHVVTSRGMPDRRLSLADQRLQKRVREAARMLIGPGAIQIHLPETGPSDDIIA